MKIRRHGPAAALAAVLALAPLWTSAGTAAASPATPTAADDVSWGVAPADTTAGTDRSHFTYLMNPGETVHDAITVVNHGDEPVTLRVYASDAFTTASGSIDLLPGDRTPTDVGSWIVMDSPSISLASQQTAVVPFTLTIPANATPGDHTGGIVTSLSTSDGGALTLDRRLGSRVYLRVTGTLHPALQLGDVQATYHGGLDPTSPGETTLTYTVTNTGNARLAAHQSVHLAGPLGLFGRTVVVADLPELLPGNSIMQTVTVAGVWPATRTSADLQLQPVASGDQPAANVPLATASATYWAWPWGQLIVLVVVAALITGYVLLRRRRRRATNAAIDRAVHDALPKASDSTVDDRSPTGAART